MPKKWIPLESNPEVITDFASRIGLDTKQWAFHDVFGLDEEVRQAAAHLCSCTFGYKAVVDFCGVHITCDKLQLALRVCMHAARCSAI